MKKLTLISICLIGLVVPLYSHELTEEQKAQVKDVIMTAAEECVKKEKVSDEDVALLKSHKIPDSRNGLCFFNCMLDSFNLLEDGKLSKDVMVEMAIPIVGRESVKIDHVKEVVDKCNEELGEAHSDECINAKNIVVCLHEKKDQIGVDVML